MKKNLLTATFLLLPVCLASAATIIQPGTPTANIAANAGTTLAGLVDGLGLSATVATGSDTAAALSVSHLTGTLSQNYVTPQSGTDYFAAGTPPALTFLLGGTYDSINSIVIWNYAIEAGVGIAAPSSTKTFDLEFFSDTAATLSLGTSTGLTLTKSLGGAPQVAQQIFFNGNSVFNGVQAVKMTLTDNYHVGSPDPNGNRVGLGEVRFSQVPEPSAGLLAGLGLLGLRRRRRG